MFNGSIQVEVENFGEARENMTNFVVLVKRPVPDILQPNISGERRSMGVRQRRNYPYAWNTRHSAV